MSNHDSETRLQRRTFLKAGGALIIGAAVAPELLAQEGQAGGVPINAASGTAFSAFEPDPNQIDSWIAIHADNTATIFIGHHELGQGISTTLLQIAAEELDLDMAQVKSIPLETGKTPNQGGTYASSGIARGGPRIRLAAAEGRQALLKLASARLGAPVERLTVTSGVVSVIGNPSQSVTYGQLVGDRRFSVQFTGTAPIKDYRTHKIVGTRVPRVDIPAKAGGKYVYMQNVRVPGMLHGRVVRPRGRGAYYHEATVVSVDESSIADIPGARVVRRKDFVGVVAPDEWSAVKAAERLRVTWDMPAMLPSSPEELFERLRSAKTDDQIVVDRGDVASAFAGAAHIASGRYDSPYQMHAPFGAHCAIADVKADSALLICSSQNIYESRLSTASVTGLPIDRITVRYVETSGTYGRSAHADCAQSAVIMSQEAGAPVRLQFMRWDDHGWEAYQPAHTADVKIGVDANGKIIAYEYHGWQHGFGGAYVGAKGQQHMAEYAELLATGRKATLNNGLRAQGPTPFNTGDMYAIPNWKIVTHRVSPLDGYLKGNPQRSPFDIAISFGGEQTMDEAAYLANLDPYLFRRHNINGRDWLSVLDAVAKAANWTPRPAASNLSVGRIRRGRGIAAGTHLSSYGAAVAEIEVDIETGVITAKHMYAAIEAGQAINPGIIEDQITGQMCQAASRMLKEEVTFSATNVTSLDWNTYPVLRFGEAPEVTAISVMRQDQTSSGAGEECLAAGAAAIANAFFDATGVRMHRFPLTPARVLQALKKA
jgi:CO/xanthine dehydrogenase Mo-binding subunit